MAIFSNASKANPYITGTKPLPTASGSELIAVRFTIDVTATDLAANNLGAVGKLPAGHVPVDVFVDATDLDAGGTSVMVLSVGIMDTPTSNDLSSAPENGGGAWGSTTASNVAFIQRLTYNGNRLVTVQKKDVDRLIGVKVSTAPGTPAAGTIGVTVVYQAA